VGRPSRLAVNGCQQCHFFGQCTASPQGRPLTLHPYRAALETRRAEAKTESFQEQFHLRAGIEATISELVRGHGLRSARYRGQAKIRLQACFTAAAVNLKRVMRWLGQPAHAVKLYLSLLLRYKNLQKPLWASKLLHGHSLCAEKESNL